MKINITLCMAFFFSVMLHAQNQTEIELFKERFNEKKVDMVASFLDLTVTEGEQFWPIYVKYENERMAINDERIRLLYQYVNSYDNLSNDLADNWSKEVIGLQEQELKNKKKYYKKMAKLLTPLLALRFFQFEEALQAEIRSLITKNIPVLENY